MGVQRVLVFGYRDQIKLEDREESLQMASDCGISVPCDNGKKYYLYDLNAFCSAQGQIDEESPHFYRIAPKWPQKVLSYWFRMEDLECHRDVQRLVLAFFHQKNFHSGDYTVYYHWIHRAVHQDPNTEHHRHKRQSLFFSELRHHLTTDGIVAVTFKFETDLDCNGWTVTTTFTLFSNGYYRYEKEAHDRCEIDDEDKSYDQDFSAHYGIWDYKANRIIMEGMALREEKEDDEDDDYTDYYDSDYYRYSEEEEEEEEDSELDDETMSIPDIDGVSYLFDFFRKEMVIDNPLAVRVHVY